MASRLEAPKPSSVPEPLLLVDSQMVTIRRNTSSAVKTYLKILVKFLGSPNTVVVCGKGGHAENSLPKVSGNT